jgi:hypothetical protein
MYSPAIHSTFVNSRIDELHRRARPLVGPRPGHAVRQQICSRASALATHFRLTMPSAPVEKYA